MEFRESHRNQIDVEGVTILKDGILIGNPNSESASRAILSEDSK
jgi:hypothetical protein